VLISTMNDIPGYEVTEVLGAEMGQNWTEICAYGTAVKIQKR
jgi:uncharacterized protein YbjQ (UPF0145 family)